MCDLPVFGDLEGIHPCCEFALERGEKRCEGCENFWNRIQKRPEKLYGGEVWFKDGTMFIFEYVEQTWKPLVTGIAKKVVGKPPPGRNASGWEAEGYKGAR